MDESEQRQGYNRRVEVRIPASLRAEIEREAQRRMTTVAALVRECLAERFGQGAEHGTIERATAK